MNARQMLQGQVNSILNDNGINEARETAKSLKKAGIEFSAVYASTLSRAIDTAKIICPGSEIIPEPRIKELSFGDYEGLAYRDIDEPLWAFIHDPEKVEPPSGIESIHSLIARTGEFLQDIIESDLSGNILAVTHGIALRAIMRNLKGEDGGVWQTPIKNCVVYKAEIKDGRAVSLTREDSLSPESKTDTSKVF